MVFFSNENIMNLKVFSVSLTSLKEESPNVRGSNTYLKPIKTYEKIPKLFDNLNPLEMEIIQPSIDMTEFQNSNTSKALKCYEILPQFILIKGIVSEYSYFLTIYHRLNCEHNHDYHDGTKCGDMLFLIDLLENKAELLKERFSRMKNHCFTLEVNAVSVQSRYFNSDGFVGRKDNILSDSEILLLERSFLRRMITQFESALTKKTIEYELNCMNDKGVKNESNCYLLRTECSLLEAELILISEEHFKRILRFQRIKDEQM